MNMTPEYFRDLCTISGLSCSTDIPSLRDFPLKCDPRREYSYQRVLDIERSRDDRPLLELKTTDPYKLRRIVVPTTRSKKMEISRIPNARDPRGTNACKRESTIKKCLKWVPTLVENDQVPLEEETCAVLVIDVNEWESTGTKSCYIETIPHECNVQRALQEVQIQLAKLDDGLLMSVEEAERHMQASASDRRPSLEDSDVQECDSDGEVLVEELPATGFDNVEDRPMLDMDEVPVEASVGQRASSSPRHFDDDEDEDNVIYLPDENPQTRPAPKSDDASVECVDLDADEAIILPKKEPLPVPVSTSSDADIECIEIDLDINPDADHLVEPKEPQASPEPKSNDAEVECIDLDDDELVEPKKEPQGAQVPLDQNVQREVLSIITIDDSGEEDEQLNLLFDMNISKGESETSRSKSGDHCPDDTSPRDVTNQDLLENPCSAKIGVKNTENEDYGRQGNEQEPFNNIGHDKQNSDCDSESALGSDILNSVSVISKFRIAENNRDYQAVEQSATCTLGSVEFSAAVPETSDIADKTVRSSDNDSNVPTMTQLEIELEVHVPATCDHDDQLIAHSKICEMRNEKTAQLTNNTPAAANFTPMRKRRRKRRTRFNSTDTSYRVVHENKRHRESVDIVVNDENKNDNCNADVVRLPSQIFKSLSKQRQRKSSQKPRENVLKLSTVSTQVISKPSVSSHRSISFSQFSAFGMFYKYLKNYTATYNSINFFCKHFEKVSIFEFLRISQFVQSNNDFWQNRLNHWHQKENNICLEDVREERTFNNQLAIKDSSSAFRDNEMATMYKMIQPREHKTAIKSTWDQQHFSIDKDVILSIKNSLFTQGNYDKDGDGKINLQKRYSLPLAIIPQQNICAKRPQSGFDETIIKLTLRKSQVDDNVWVTTAGTDTIQNMPTECTVLSTSNDIVQNTPGQIIANKATVSGKPSLIINKPCTYVNKVLHKWSCIDKEVPELEIDDFINRPIPQKIQFDRSKLSVTLQSRVKKRSVDITIVSDVDGNTCKRRKLTDSTKDYESSMNNILNKCDGGSSVNDDNKEFSEITELPPDSCIELSRPTSINICNLPTNNNEAICQNSENQESYNLKDLANSCCITTAVLNEQGLKLDENNAPCLENVDHYLQNDNFCSNSNSSFHLEMEDELENPATTVESHHSDIQIDYNCNLQKDLNIILNTHQDERNLIEHSEKQKNSDSDKLFAKEVDKVRECNVDEVKKIIAVKLNCNINRTDAIRPVQNDIQLDNPMESRLQSTQNKQSACNKLEEFCVKSSLLRSLNFAESELMNTIINNEEEQETLSEKDLSIDATFEKDNHLNYNESPSEDDDQIITCGSMTPVQSDPPKNFDQDENCSDVLSSQTLINTKKHHQVDSNNTLESETSLSMDNQHAVICNEKLDSDFSHCKMNDHITSGRAFQSDEHCLGDTMNVLNNPNVEHSPSEGEKTLEYKEHGENDEDLYENEEVSNINTSNSLLNQDQVLPIETVNLEDDLEEGDFDFLASIQGIKTNPKYEDDDYDVNSDRDEYDYQSTVKYSSDTNITNFDESSDCNENIDISNCKRNRLEKDDQPSTIEPKQSTVSEDENLHNLQKPPMKITNPDAAKSKFSYSDNVNEGDDEVIIQYETTNESRILKVVKLDISNINNDSNLPISELCTVRVSNLNTCKDINVDNQSEEQKTILRTSPSQPSFHSNNSAVERIQLHTESNTETMNCFDESEVGIPISDTNVVLPIANNSSATFALEISESCGSNDKVSNVLSVNSTLAPEPTIQPNKTFHIDFNNPIILQKFNLNKEIIVPEDVMTEKFATLEKNVEEQILSNTLENMLKDNYGKKCTDEQNHPNRNVEVPAKSSIIIECALPVNEGQSGDNYDLLKALNINLDNEVDIITEKMLYKCSDKHEPLGGIKVKNLNDMLQKPGNFSVEKVPLNQHSGNPLPNIPENSQQNINHGVVNIHSQSSFPGNIFIPKNVIPTPPFGCRVNHPMPVGLAEPLMNAYNILQAPVPIMNNIRQPIHLQNIGLANKAPIQNSTPATTSPDKQPFVLASKMFPGLFDSHATSSFCSQTVFNLQLPPLQNIILPPPYTLLRSHNQTEISDKIQKYKWELLTKIIRTLTKLENIGTNIIKRHFEILFNRETLTIETWNIQKKILIIAQCIGSLQKLTTERNYSNIIKAIMGTIHTQVCDQNLLKKIFGIFNELKKQGVFKTFSLEQQPLTKKLGINLLKQSVVGMSSGQKEILNYQIKIYKEMLKINDNQLQSNRVPKLNNHKKKQVEIQKSSPMVIQQNVVTTTNSSPVTDTSRVIHEI